MSMKWSETIAFNRPLLSVALLTDAPAGSWEALLHSREESAYQKGRLDGESALSAQLIQQRTEIAELQRGVLSSLSGALSQVIQESQTALIQLALEAAGRVVADTPINAGMVDAVVRDALRQVEDTSEISIQLHPQDLELLRNNDSALLQGLPDKGPLRFVGSSEVSRGGCLVQTRFGVIDARREIKMQQLSESLSV
jgi:flagellar assembly protein FliH